MPRKSKKRKLENNELSSSRSKKPLLIDDQAIVESAKKIAVPTPKQLDPAERQRKQIAYRNFLNRGGPDAPGSKSIPKGAPGCLKALTFVITGVLPSLERDECKKLIESYGGRVTTAVSGKTNYLISGRDSGKTKTDKANKLRTKIISEDDLLDMIRTRSGNDKIPENKPTFVSKSSTKFTFSQPGDDILWIDKYKPKSLSQIVGQQTDKSPMKKLIYFLTNWHTWHSTKSTRKRKTSTSTSISPTDPSQFKAVLLTGPPGIGKTLTAQLACKALNMPFIEKNASDNRSQTTINKFEINSSYINEQNQTINKHVLIMDEIDGLIGNEDRGGIQELIKQIQTTRIPIILIVNDRHMIKLRTLISYCYEIKFDRASFLNVKSFILDICSKENIHITHNSIDNLIHMCNRDIRKTIQTLNLYYKQSLTTKSSNLTDRQTNLSINSYDSCMKLFSSSNINLIDKINLYFNDSSLMPLLIQENYIRVVPTIKIEEKQIIDSKKRIELISNVADSLSIGDICSKLNFFNDNRSLMNYQAMFFGYIPSTYIHGSLDNVQFPNWFNFIQQKKNINRTLIELNVHCCLKTLSTNRNEFNLDYIPIFNDLFKNNLHQTTMKNSIHLMNNYYFNENDVEMIFFLSKYGKMNRNQFEFNTKVKNLLNKSYEKQHYRKPFEQRNIYENADEDDDDDDDNFNILKTSNENDKENHVIKQMTSKSKRRKIQ